MKKALSNWDEAATARDRLAMADRVEGVPPERSEARRVRREDVPTEIAAERRVAYVRLFLGVGWDWRNLGGWEARTGLAQQVDGTVQVTASAGTLSMGVNADGVADVATYRSAFDGAETGQTPWK
jgi:hypothetical protein